jgi:hypothetical protein
MVLWKTDYLISTEWTFVKIFFHHDGASVYSCPDFFRLPNSDVFVFGSLDGNYFLGNYTSVSAAAAAGVPSAVGDGGGESVVGTSLTPTFTPFRDVPAQIGRSLGIWKTGGVGANNVMNKTSRRIFWGTIGWTGGYLIPSRDPVKMDWLHTGSIAALPRDLSLTTDGALGFSFAPELATLRDVSSHVHSVNVTSNNTATIFKFNSTHAEIIATFPAAAASSSTGSLVGIAILGSASAPPSPPNSTSPCPNPFAPCVGWDRGGNDMKVMQPYAGNISSCEALCTADAACLAWTWCGPGSIGPMPRCCLKSAVPDHVGAFAHMVRCAFFDRNLHSRMPLSFTPSDPLEATMCDVNDIPLGCSLPLTGWHGKMRRTTD